VECVECRSAIRHVLAPRHQTWLEWKPGDRGEVEHGGEGRAMDECILNHMSVARIQGRKEGVAGTEGTSSETAVTPNAPKKRPRNHTVERGGSWGRESM
jgi:hypothetical protein